MTDYHTELNITSSTEADELVDFAKKQANNPFQYNKTTVYNFSTHEIDVDALKSGIDSKFNRNLYQIPMQILTGQAFIQSILPKQIQESEILLYRPEENDYYAYRNFVRDTPSEYQDKVRQEIAEIIRKHE